MTGTRMRWRMGLTGATLVILGLLAFDLSRPPDAQVTSRLALGAIRAYQAHLSPHLGNTCRFTPSCSNYARLAIQKYGAFGGSARAAWRVMRCGPWTKTGTIDWP